MVEDDTPVAPLEEDGAPQTIIDLIQQDLQELGEKADTYIPVIGHERTGLAVRYMLPQSGKVLDNIATKVERETKDKYLRNLNTAIDTMLSLCEGLFVKPDGVEDYVMLDPQEIGMPVKFDARLAAIIGIAEDAPARAVVKKLFANNEMAIMSHAERMSRWLNNTKADLEVEVWQLGN